METITKWLTDPDADDYPFPHNIGERLRSQDRDLEGIVRNAKYSSTKKGDDARITYYLATDTGEIIQLPAHELEKVGQPIQQPLLK